MLPDTSMRVVYIGSLTPRRLHLAAQYWKHLLSLRLPFRCRLQEMCLSPQDAKSQGEGGEGRLLAQPVSFQHIARLTSRPRLSQQPMIIRLTGERPGPGQRPMTGRRWGVPQWSILTASPPLLCHCFPFQQPIKIQSAHLAGTTLKFVGFISRLQLTPDRICLPPIQELTAQDLASPHLLYSNPPPNPSLDCLLGH